MSNKEDQSILEWANESTAIEDILLLLSLFTGRDVFDVDEGFVEDGHVTITADPQCYQYGGLLRTSIPYERSLHPGIDCHFYDIGFEKKLNNIYQLMKTIEWQEKFNRGFFLLLAKQAFRCQTIESTFVQCWTIWEHLYVTLNKGLSINKIRKIHASTKIAFLLNEYCLVDKSDNNSIMQIKSLAEIRNRLIHFGRFPERSFVHDNAQLFIRLTEFILAKTLELFPSNVFNTIEKLEQFLFNP